MIEYRLDQEKEVALYFARLLTDDMAIAIIEAGVVKDASEAIHLSQFFWRAVNRSAQIKLDREEWPFESGSEFWTEKLYNSFGGYLERTGYENIWNEEMDKN
jgi:hypothetical protein